MKFNINNIFFHNQKKMYIIGFLLSIIFTVIPFFLIITKILPRQINYIILLSCAVIQILVHFICFLELNFSLEKRWNVVSILFVMIIIFIIIFGSIWILNHLNHHIMFSH